MTPSVYAVHKMFAICFVMIIIFLVTYNIISR